MKKVLTIIIALLLILIHGQGFARSIDLKTARATAIDFLKTKAPSGRLTASPPRELWIHEEQGLDASSQPAFYIVSTDKGFVIVAGDDRARQVLAYSDYPLDNMDDIPDNMRFFLELYKRQIEVLQAQPDLMPSPPPINSGNRALESIPPLLASEWGQTSPYNLKCPMVDSTRAVVGCSAVSLAQVMRYWQYPASCDSLPSYITRTTGLYVDALPPTSFSWELMLDKYRIGGNHTSEQLAAVTTLMRYVAQAEHMDYRHGSSDATEFDILDAIRFFGFDKHAFFAEKTSLDGTTYYSDPIWEVMLHNELKSHRPVIYCGYSMTSDTTMTGHAFNVDGYNAEDGTFHVNFGWRGTGNGYYALNAFTLTNYVFNIGQIMFLGVEPPVPDISVSDDELDMNGYVGEITTDTIYVSGYYLTGEITAVLNSDDDAFSIEVMQDTLGGTAIVVTYNPQNAGECEASIVISSEGAQDVTVFIYGNASIHLFTPVMLPADSAAITTTSFRADWTDETRPDVVASYILEVATTPEFLPDSAEYRIFTNIDTTCCDVDTLTPGNTYYYRVRTLYNDSTLSEWSNVESVTLPVPPAPELSVSTEKLILTGYVGETVTDTITVSGTNLTGDITEILDSDNDAFSIEVLQDSLGDVMIVVTYSPQNAGESEASIVISSEGAQDVTVFIYGNASIHLFTPVMMPADSAAITTTSFRADWADETQPDVVASYILEVATTPEFLPDSAEYRIFTNIDTTCCDVDTLTPGNTYYYRVRTLYNDSTLSEWSNVENVTLPVPPTPELSVSTEKLILTGYVGETVTDTITVSGTNLTGDITEILDSDNDAFSIEVLQDSLGDVIIVVTYSPQNAGESEASIVISSEGAQDVTVFVHGNASIHLFTPVMLPADSAAITTTSFRADWTDETQPDVVASYILEVATTPEFLPDSAEYRIFTNIDTTCCDVDTLTPGNTYYYRVKTRYNDSTLSEWSNVESVTLPVPAEEHGFELGDINHDGLIGIADVTWLVEYLLDIIPEVCPICSDVNQDGIIGIADISSLTDILLEMSHAPE